MKVAINIPRKRNGVTIIKDADERNGVANSQLQVTLDESEVAFLKDPKQEHFKKSTRFSIKCKGLEFVNMSLHELALKNIFSGEEDEFKLEFGGNLPEGFEINFTFDNSYYEDDEC